MEKPGLKVLNEGTLTVALDTVVTPDLLKEGYARDLVRGIQNLRKESGFEVTDRISLVLGGDEDLRSAFEAFRNFVAGEILADSIEWTSVSTDLATSIEAGEKTWKAEIRKS
jgi:isoleucyl-tRNA synthetase